MSRTSILVHRRPANFCSRQVHVTKGTDETEAQYLDRKTRTAARWYQNHLKGKANVLLITNDQEKKQLAVKEGIAVQTSRVQFLFLPDLLVHEYVRSTGDAELSEAIIGDDTRQGTDDLSDSEIPDNKQIYYEKV